MYELSEQMFNAVFNLGEDYRRLFCLKQCLEHNCIYILKEKLNEGTPLFFEDEAQEGDDENSYHIFLPIWCHPRYVEYYLEHNQLPNAQDYEIVELKLDIFNTKWAPTLKDNHIALAILPLENDKDFCIDESDVLTKPLEPQNNQ